MRMFMRIRPHTGLIDHIGNLKIQLYRMSRLGTRSRYPYYPRQHPGLFTTYIHREYILRTTQAIIGLGTPFSISKTYLGSQDLRIRCVNKVCMIMPDSLNSPFSDRSFPSLCYRLPNGCPISEICFSENRPGGTIGLGKDDLCRARDCGLELRSSLCRFARDVIRGINGRFFV
jgi:hypothetical protein